MLMWDPILNHVNKYTKRPGNITIFKIKALIGPLEIGFQKNNGQLLSVVIGQIGKLYKELVPYVTNEQLAEAVSYGGDVCKEISERLKTNTITLKEIAIFAKDTAIKLTSAME